MSGLWFWEYRGVAMLLPELVEAGAATVGDHVLGRVRYAFERDNFLIVAPPSKALLFWAW